MLILFLFASPLFVASLHVGATSTSSTGVIVPLYVYPGTMWQGLIQAKHAYPSVPIIAIINPSSGPGTWQDPNILQGVKSLQSAGIAVAGYIYTSYASRSIYSAESDIRAYKYFYGVNGIFLDQMSNVPGYEWYYSTLNSYAKSLGMTITVGNPGTTVPSSFIDTVDILNIYENKGLPSISSLASWTSGYSKSNFAMTTYGVSSVSSSYVSSASKYLGYMYITDGSYPNPYTALPWYFSNLLADLSTSSDPPTTLTVNSVNLGGSPISGLWTVIRSSSGVVLATGYTPFTYAATSGTEYIVSVSNYGNYVFSHWSNGVTSNSITITPTQSTTLVAYYNTGSTQVPLTVNSVTLTGSPISGLWTVIRSPNGNILATGYTPFTYAATSGTEYIVSVSNYGSYVFSHWSNGVTSNSITITPTQSTTLYAYYS